MSCILVVDDHAIVREPLARLLRLEGYQTLSAGNGIEALALLDKHSADVILLDLMMPKKDGVGFLETLRADPRWKQVPVILLTGVIEGSLLDHARQFNLARVMAKARFTLDELFACIREQLIARDCAA